MPNPMVAMTGGSLASGAYNANQAQKGAKAQIEAGDRAAIMEQQSADKQLELQREIWEKQQADYKDYLDQGTWGINRLGDLMRNQSATPQVQKTAQTGGVLSNLNNVNWNKGNGFTSAPAKTSQPVNPLIPNYDVFNTVPDFSMPVSQQAQAQAQAKPLTQTQTQTQTPQYQNNANGGFLNNPFDSYLASKGVSNKFDPSNTRLASLMSQGSGQLNNPFDTYLASKGLAGGKFDTNNPAYQFQLKQGQQALDRSSAARGMGYSGAQMKASQEYGQGLASQQYDKEYNRASGEFGDYYRLAGNEYDRANQQYTNEYNRASGEFGDYFNRLAGLSQGGQQAAGSMAQAGSQYANNASNTFGNLSNAQTNILGQQANARASGYAGQANAVTGGLNSLTNLYGMSKWGK